MFIVLIYSPKTVKKYSKNVIAHLQLRNIFVILTNSANNCNVYIVLKVDLEVRGKDCEKAMKSKLSEQIVDILKHSMICTRQKAGFKIIIFVRLVKKS